MEKRMYRVVQKTDHPWLILTITSVNMDQFKQFFSQLKQEIYEAQKLSHFSHLTFIMLPLYLVKQNTDAGINANFSGSCIKTN